MATQENTRTVEIDRDELDFTVSVIRHSLMTGLAAYGEVERLREEAAIAIAAKIAIPKGMQPIDVSGAVAEISSFADAMRMLEHLAKRLEPATD